MPFSDLYALLKRGQGQIGGLGGAGGAGLGGTGYAGGTPPFFPTQRAGNPYGTPPFAPPVGDPGVDPSIGGTPVPGFSGIDPGAARGDAILSVASSLLKSGRTKTGPRINGAEALGDAISAGQQGYENGINGQLQRLLLKSRIAENERQASAGAQDPALVAEFKYAQSQGFAGSFQDYIKSKQGPQSQPADIQAYEYYNKLTPEQQKQFLEIKRNSQPFQVVDYAGGKGKLNRVTGELEQVTTAAQEAAGAGTVAQGTASGTAAGQAQGAIDKKAIGAKSVLQQVDLAEQLIPFATGSAPGAAYDAAVKFFGGAPDGAKAIAQLKVIQAGLVSSMPRLEGPQSDADRVLYIEAAGQIGDPTVPAEVKKAALQTIRRIQQQYAEAGSAQVGGATAAPSAAPASGKRPPLSSFRR